MPKYQLIKRDIEAMRFEGTRESAQAICDWANQITGYPSKSKDYRACVLAVKMRVSKPDDKDAELVLQSLNGVTLLINAGEHITGVLVEAWDFVVRHEYPLPGVHVRCSQSVLGSYQLDHTNE